VNGHRQPHTRRVPVTPRISAKTPRCTRLDGTRKMVRRWKGISFVLPATRNFGAKAIARSRVDEARLGVFDRLGHHAEDRVPTHLAGTWRDSPKQREDVASQGAGAQRVFIYAAVYQSSEQRRKTLQAWVERHNERGSHGAWEGRLR